MPRLVPHHIAGKLNVEADWLSRPDQQLKTPVPPRLHGLTVGSLTHEQIYDHELPPPGMCGVQGSNSMEPLSICEGDILLTRPREEAGREGSTSCGYEKERECEGVH